jgi:hypothetical protein
MGLMDELARARLPRSQLERAKTLQNLLIERAEGHSPPEATYKVLREVLIDDEDTRTRLLEFVRTATSLSAFWGYIKDARPTYKGRREHIRAAFRPIMSFLDGANATPAEPAISEALASFDPEGVHAAWEKAATRKRSDPDGAITAAKSLLESVCKGVLDKTGAAYGENDDLPSLYFLVAKQLQLAPSQHSEAAFKAIFGGCQNIVNKIAELRNKLGDAHGKGGNAAKAKERHAELAVNLAGSMALFLVQTWQEISRA